MADGTLLDNLKALRAWENTSFDGYTVAPEYVDNGRDGDTSPTGRFIIYKNTNPGADDARSDPVGYADPKAINTYADSDGYTRYALNQDAYKNQVLGPKPQVDITALKNAKQLSDIDTALADIEARMQRARSGAGDGFEMELDALAREARPLLDQKARLAGSQSTGGSYSQVLKQALDAGVDLRPLYGTTYADAVQFKQDLGQYAGKDQSMIIPANPVGYSGQFQFDPNFGSTFYRDLATQAGKALGLSDEQILQKGTEYFADKFASGPSTKGVIGFTDFGTGLMDAFAETAGVPKDQLDTLKTTALKPLYDASQQVFSGLNGAARVESQSSGFFKGIGQSIAKLGPIGTIALTAALGPSGAGLSTALAAGTAAAIPGLLQGDIKGGLTSGALAGLGAGALKGIGSTVADVAGGGTLGNIAGGLAQGATSGGLGALLTGGDVKQALLNGAVQGGVGGLLQPTNTVGGIDDSNYDLGKSLDSFANLGGMPAVGGIDDSEFDLGKSLEQMDLQLGIPGTVGGIDDSNFDLGKTLDRQDTLQNTPISTDTKTPDVTKPAVNALLKLLLGGGAAAGIARGLGGLGGTQTNTAQPGGWQMSNLAAADPLQRTMSFTPQAVEYTSGLNGQPLQAPQYDVINPQANPNAGYLRAFAEGGAINQGIGSMPGMAAGRMLEGPGDGMSDHIPATIEGQEPVRLADGEYVLPAQVVSALGSGSSKAGSKVLDAMVERVYTAQTGKPKQMKPMKTNKVLPA